MLVQARLVMHLKGRFETVMSRSTSTRTTRFQKKFFARFCDLSRDDFWRVYTLVSILRPDAFKGGIDILYPDSQISRCHAQAGMTANGHDVPIATLPSERTSSTIH